MQYLPVCSICVLSIVKLGQGAEVTLLKDGWVEEEGVC
jgi:hypothetical protein